MVVSHPCIALPTVKQKFAFNETLLSRVCVGAVIFLFHAIPVCANPPIGQVWQRSVDWTVPADSADGTTNGNPAADAQGNLVWQYESVPLGQALGQPTTGGLPPTPWCSGVPTKLTWDASWFGGAGGWTGGDDVSPLIQQTNLIQTLIDNTSVPVIRWLNPTVSNITVALSGTLTLSWSGAQLTQPIDFIMMLQKPNGSTTPLLLASRKPASFPGGPPSETPLILVDLPAVQIPAGGSIFYTMQYEETNSPYGWITLDDSSLTITLKALAAVPLPANDTAVTDENELVNVEVLANDQWAPHALPRVSVIVGPAHGTAAVRADQSIDYTPATNYVGTDVLTYQIYDGAATASATLTVTVNQPYYLYVSTNGNDTNTGTAWTNALASVTGARNQIRALRAQNPNPLTNLAVEVVLDDGAYATNQTILFTAGDSGTPQYPVTYRSRHPLQASISGGQTLNLNWQPYAAVPGAYVADLSTAGLAQSQLNNLHTLIVSGSRAVRARLPDTGFYAIVSADPDTSHTYNKMNAFTFGNSDGLPNINSSWTNLTNVEVISYAAWTESRMAIASVDATNSQVHIQGSLTESWANDYLADYGAFLEPNSPYNQTGATDGTIRYYIENVLEGLDTPGEWYVDPTAARLYYYPRAGETITNSTFIVSVVNQLIQITNASNLRFDGLNFCDTDWTMPATGQPGTDEAIFISTPNTILISGATNVICANDRVAETGGGYGIQIQFGATGNAVVNTEFVDNAGGGVMIGGTPGLSDPTSENGYQSYIASNRVSLNYIHDNNAVWREACGIMALRNGYNRIAGNIISDTTYSGIALGWFDTNPLAVGHNQIAWNTVSDFGTTLYDLGGIYVVGSQPYTTIMGNKISGALWGANHLHHGGVNYPPDGTNDWNNPGGPITGIYTDDTSAGELIDGNIIYNVNQGLFIHDTHDDIYFDNMFIDTQSQIWATVYAGNTQGYVDAGPLWIASSIIAWTEANPVPIILFDSYQPIPSFVMDNDVYCFGPATIQNPQSNGLPYLQSTGHEQHALVTTNSLFVSPPTQDYRIGISAQPLVLSQGFSADWLLQPAVSAISPFAQFTAAPATGFAPLQVIFTDASTGTITNWLWNFGDGNTLTNTTNSNVTNTYATAGRYTVSLTVTGPGGTNTSTLAGFIAASPAPVIGSVSWFDGQLIFSGTNCPAGVQYRILTSTNLGLPLAIWQPLVTNAFLSDGSYSYTNSVIGSRAFFRLVSP